MDNSLRFLFCLFVDGTIQDGEKSTQHSKPLRKYILKHNSYTILVNNEECWCLMHVDTITNAFLHMN